MAIQLKRVYEKPSKQDGCRILVERLWPRGLSKPQAKVDLWLKEAAPSTALRQWFQHDPAKWKEFKRRYFLELEENNAVLHDLQRRASKGKVTFVYGSREERLNSATALKEYIETHFRSVRPVE